jgi:hypothetical protein
MSDINFVMNNFDLVTQKLDASSMPDGFKKHFLLRDDF